MLRREPMILFWALLFPVGLLIVLGSSVSSKPKAAFGGLSFIVVYTPVLMTFTLTLLALSAMPATLASYRDKGYLKRLSTTPIGAMRLLAAQLALVVGLSISVVVLIMLVSHFAYSVPLPSEVGGFILAILLTMTAMASLAADRVARLQPARRRCDRRNPVLPADVLRRPMGAAAVDGPDAAHDQPVHAARRRRAVDHQLGLR